MKKTLFIGLMVAAGFNVCAQKAVPGGREVRTETVGNSKTFASPAKPQTSHDKKTRGGRWYDPLEAALFYFNSDTTGLDANTNSVPMWSDSTMRVRYTAAGGDYYGGLWFKGAAEVLDPFAKRFNGTYPATPYLGEMAITPMDAYTVDTVAWAGVYYRNANKANVVDTLIVSVGYGNMSGGTSAIGARYVLQAANAATTIACYPGIDTMTLPALDLNMGSFILEGTGVITKKILLMPADSGARFFSTSVNMNVPAGNLVASSIVFKSGDTWIPNVDTMPDFNFFRLLYTEENANLVQNYEKKDFNTDQRFENDTTGWGTSFIPNYLYVIGNPSGCTGANQMEHFWTLWHLTSNATAVVKVDDIEIFNNFEVYPNPATDKLNFTFSLINSAKNISISLTNVLGQEVKRADIGGAQANVTKTSEMNVSGLPAGIYIYTIEADGQKTSNRVLIN